MEILLPTLSQRDSRWKDKKLGTSNSTIGGYGCLLTCWAMVAKYYGKDTDPDRLNEALKTLPNNGGFQGSLYVWGGVTKIYSDITETKQVKTPDPVSSTQFSSIEAELNAGRPVIAEVDFIPATLQTDMHFVVIIGKNGDDWIVADPYYGDKSSLTRYGKPSATIQRFVFTFGPIPTPVVDKPNEDQARALKVITEAYNALPNDDKKPGNMEAYCRTMVDQFKVFDGYKFQADQFSAFIEKWFTEWNLASDPNKSHQLLIEEEMGKLVPFEDLKNKYRLAIEDVVGHPMDDDASLLKSLSAIHEDKESIKGKLEECLLKVDGKIVKAFPLGKYIVRIIKKSPPKAKKLP